MRRFNFLPVVCIAIFILMAALAYTRPMPIEELYPDTELSDCVNIRAFALKNLGGDRKSQHIPAEFEKGSDDYHRLISEFRSRKFRRSLLNWLPRGNSRHEPEAGDFTWELILRLENEKGEENKDNVIHMRNFYGRLEYFSADGKTVRCFTENQTAWINSVMKMISQDPS